jgi:hypothetical protein
MRVGRRRRAEQQRIEELSTTLSGTLATLDSALEVGEDALTGWQNSVEWWRRRTVAARLSFHAHR